MTQGGWQTEEQMASGLGERFALLPLVEGLVSTRAFQRALADLPGPGEVRVYGVPSAPRALVVAALAFALQRPVVVLTAHVARAREIADVLPPLLDDAARVHYFADPEPLPYERLAWSRETRRQRLAALAALAQRGRAERPPVVVAPVRALLWPTLPPRELRLTVRTVRVGDVLPMSRFTELLVDLGYTPTALVETPGTFSRRGGILDVFLTNTPWPVRVEYFGDEVDSLRFFDPESQRTLSHVPRPDAITLAPASEALPRFGTQAGTQLRDLDLTTCHPAFAEQVREEVEQIVRGELSTHQEYYLPFFYSRRYSLFDHLPEDTLILVEEIAELRAEWENVIQEAEKLRADLVALRELPGNYPRPYLTWDDIAPQLQRFPVIVLGHTSWDGTPVDPGREVFRGVFAAPPFFRGQVRQVIRKALALRERGAHVVFVSRQAPRLAQILTEHGYPTKPTATLNASLLDRGISVVHGVLPGGFILHAAGNAQTDSHHGHPIWLLTDVELFGFRKVARRPLRVRPTSPDRFFSDFKPGDYVVHIDHGIGIYRGLVRMHLDGQEREYLLVEYAQGDKLYVPVYQADRLARYVGPEGAPPVLNRLGTADWALVKRRAKRAVAELAKELLELYALRETLRGHAFSPDTPWQQELEASFPYEETEDQLRAIEEVKRDMEKPRPMDRLVVGDVGFGKTEVAIRAAFKAVMDGKQVAVLVPTTVLAQQHYRTFRERLAPFPVHVAMLSRFLTRKEQEKVLAGLRRGSVDIVIGTHRLLSDDVRFKDLGLLIIDEEQRFGVAHKEKLKKLRANVDVLTLSATPIPRTLHMSLTGIRDLSTIETPPEDRFPVHTTVAEFDEHLIRQAIVRELERGGQVYFVHNRVEEIERMAETVRRLVPRARVGIAHGQMPERELEQVMLAFAEGAIDVLVCTTIIENGLDIPNANTIIINRADQFGLAQLYQLRGRVGRGPVRAYAYLLYDKGKRLSPEARRRLEAIYEATDLGAGFRVALYDLELRGAGELLGARQHGHIAAVGFDLYARLLAKVVQELKERGEVDIPEEPPTAGESDTAVDPLPPSVQLDLPVEAYLPREYLPDDWVRLQTYRRIAAVGDLAEVEALRQELEDRFGPLPEPAAQLLFVVRVKLLAQQAGVQRIGREGRWLTLYSDRLHTMASQALARALGEGVRVGRRHIYVEIDTAWRQRLERVLETLSRR